jgi:hypothetical protein
LPRIAELDLDLVSATEFIAVKIYDESLAAKLTLKDQLKLKQLNIRTHWNITGSSCGQRFLHIPMRAEAHEAVA